MKYRQIGLSLAIAALLAAPVNAQTRVQQNGLDVVNPATVSNPNPVQVDIGGSAMSASNPIPVQVSQGNAANAATNPNFVQTTDGTTANGATAPEYTTLSTTTAANTTSTNTTVGTMAATVTLTAASRHIKIRNNTTTSNGYQLFVVFTGTATSGAYAIDAQTTETFELAAPATSFSVIGSHATTAYSVFAD